LSKRPGAPPTIIDVARKAGVSIKTVSRVLNKEPTVHPDTRAMVLDVVTELNYRPQLSARSLAGARSFLLGLLYDEPSAGFASGLQRGATARCRMADYHLVVEALRVDGADLRARIEHMIAALRPDGVILAPPVCENPAVLATLRASGTPCVLIAPGHPRGFAHVRMDDMRAAEEITGLMVDLGHTRVGFVRGKAESASERRQAGYERALRARGLAVDPALVMPGRFEFDSGFEAGRQLLSVVPRPTAIFAANDEMALGVIAAAQRAGLTVPGDLSVAGFDDSRAASLVWPSLTTVRQPLVEMADAAVDMLISGEVKPGLQDDPPSRVLPHKLIVRGTTAQLVRVVPSYAIAS
jgi:LacI family transcriptional regulator